jgi:hypothetical protein
MMYQVTEITFDLSTDDDSIPEEHIDLVQQELMDEYVGTQWVVDDEDDLIEEITCQSGWCINSIEYVEVKS